eukprot:508614-Rhodomonas_salina.2
MRTEAELALVAPQDRRPGLDAGLGQNVVEVDHLVPAFVFVAARPKSTLGTAQRTRRGGYLQQ